MREFHSELHEREVCAGIKVKNSPDRLADFPDSFVVPPPPAGTR